MQPGDNQVPEDTVVLGKRKRSLGDHDETARIPSPAPVACVEDMRPDDEILDPRISCLRPIMPDIMDSEDLCRPTPTIHGLPVEIIQRILTFLDPVTLGRMMRVQRTFQALLDPRRPLPERSGLCGNLPFVSQNTLWSISRMTFFPGSPDPLTTMTEYAMLQLVHGRTCQNCGRPSRSRSTAKASSVWTSGPGPDGVRIIWPFKIRSCADCLEPLLVKEQELILSDASALKPGLPSACFTPSINYVAATTLRQSKVPAKLSLTKYYFKPQVDDLQAQAEHIRAVASAAFKQWYKGLEPTLHEFMTDVARLEQWDITTGELNLAASMHLDHSSISSYSGYSGIQASSAAPSVLSSTNHTTWHHRKSSSKMVQTSDSLTSVPPAQTYQQNLTSFSRGQITGQELKFGERSLHDINRAKNDRKIEIERRALQLEPALPLTELWSMKAFNAALQIPRQLDDEEWERLKMRLLAERNQPSIGVRHDQDAMSSQFPTRDTVIEPIPDAVDHESTATALIDRAHRSTREKLSEIGAEFIRRCWMGGTNITEETAPRFAIDVLQHVSRRFYEVQEQEDAALALQGHPPPGNSESGMRTRTLQLRHMRHVFDICVKPYTDFVLKDLFLCSGCETPEKRFAFNALVQHYAAKHTSAFSKGLHVVHWSNEWPASPPYLLEEGNVQAVVARPDTIVHLRDTIGSAPFAHANMVDQYLTRVDRDRSDLLGRLTGQVDTSERSERDNTEGNTGAKSPLPVLYKHDISSYNSVRSNTNVSEGYHATQRRFENEMVTGVTCRKGSLPSAEYEPSDNNRYYNDPHYGLSAEHRESRLSRGSPKRSPFLPHEQSPLVSSRDAASTPSRPHPPFPGSRASERAIDDFLEGLEPLASDDSKRRILDEHSYPSSHLTRPFEAVPMDRRSNISQPRKRSQQLLQEEINRSRPPNCQGYTQAEYQNAIPVPPSHEDDHHPSATYARDIYDGRYRQESHFSHSPNSEYHPSSWSNRFSPVHHRYVEAPDPDRFNSPQARRPMYEARDDAASYRPPGEPYAFERSFGNLRYANRHDDVQSAPPPLPLVRQRYWDSERQTYVVIEREYVPLPPEPPRHAHDQVYENERAYIPPASRYERYRTDGRNYQHR